MAGDRTIPRLWRDAVAKNTGTAYLVEGADGWQGISWAEAAERVELLANGLLARGVRKGDAFAILARTSLEWALFDFALAHVGAVGAAIYANSSPRTPATSSSTRRRSGSSARTRRSGEGRGGAGPLPRLQHVLTYADLPALEDEGRAYREAHPEALDDAVAAIDEEDLFTFIYTSGTTGPPKGCMIRHRNYYVMVSVVDQMPRYIDPGDVMLLFLPLAHNFGRLAHLSGPFVGITIAFLPDPLEVARAMPEVRPMIMPSVPRVYEKVHTAVSSAFDDATGVRRKLVDWALGVGREASALRAQGRRSPRARVPAPAGRPPRLREGEGAARWPPADADLRWGAAREGDRRVLRRARDPDPRGLRPDRVHDGGDDQPHRSVPLRHRRPGAAGLRAPGRRRRRAARQERDGLRRVLQGGRGDGRGARRGRLAPHRRHRDDRRDGFVTITDRKKDIIVTAGGKNIAPQNLENDLKTSKYVSQAIVIGDRRPYPAALITLDPVEIGKWAAEQGLDGDVAALATDPKVTELVAGIVDDVNSERSRYEQLKRFRILDRDFELAQEELTPTLKLKRRVVLEHFADEVERLYDTAPAPVVAGSTCPTEVGHQARRPTSVGHRHSGVT